MRAVAEADWDLGAEIDRLYGVAPEDFVGEREALVRRLRGERRRDEAKDVHALRKPSQAAWVINRVARQDLQLADDVVSAGDALREAQLGLASGGADALRAAASAQHDAVNRFRQAARHALAAEGLAGEELLRRIQETLLAAATDPELAERVRTGSVVKEKAPVGFGPLAAAPSPLPTKPKKGKAAASEHDPARGRADEEAREAAKEDGGRRAELQARVREARATEARVHEGVAQLEAALDKAETRRATARGKVDEATRKLAQAEAQAADLERTVAQARDEAERASVLLRELEAEAPQ